MSYSGTHVYLRAEESSETVARWLAEKNPSMRLSGTCDVSWRGAEISISLDTHPCVREEALYMSQSAAPAVRAALQHTTQRIVIEPQSPKTDPDDIYNQLLEIFEVLCAMPNSVGMDPFDGAFYLGAVKYE